MIGFKISNDSDIILFADDNNIFIRATSKGAAYVKPNEILQKILNYMYFSSKPLTYKPEESDLENEYYLKIHDNILPKVIHTKFLGVIIDDRLSWDHHNKALTKKLSLYTGSYCIVLLSYYYHILIYTYSGA